MTSSGMSTFDLLNNLGAAQRTLTRLFLRHIRLTEAALREALAALPENKQLAPDEVEKGLQGLLENGWIQRVVIDGSDGYALKQQSKS